MVLRDEALEHLSEALKQQTAASEVLQLISASPSELGAVFDAILVNATRLCEAKFGILLLWEGDAFRTVALHNAPPAFVKVVRPAPVTSLGRLVATKQVDHVQRKVMSTAMPGTSRLSNSRALGLLLTCRCSRSALSAEGSPIY